MAQYSHGVILVWGLAGAEAQAAGHDTIEPGHLLLALCKLPDLPVEEVMHAGATEARKRLESIKAELAELRRAFDHVGLDRTAFRRRLRDVLGTGHGNVQGPGQIHRSSESRKVFAQAERIARAAGSPIRPIHLLAAVLEVEDSPWEQLLAEMDVEATDLARVAKGGQTSAGEAGKEKRPSVVQEADRPERPHKQARQPDKVSVLEKFGRDLTRLAADGKLDPVIGRRNEMRTLAGVLMQKRKNSAILIGEAGVGKTCVVEGLAQRIVRPRFYERASE